MAQAKKESAIDVFERLNNVNVNGHTDTISETGLTYLSWCWAWAEVKKAYPDANYEIVKFDGLPYVFDAKTGYMVYTKVTIEGQTYEMWLPVMDRHNAAMKAEPYEVKTRYKSYTVPAATMFDINKAIMRCLVKNLAMFGLGLYIYAGEDLPETEADEAKAAAPKAQPKKAEAPKAEQVNQAELETAIYAAKNASTMDDLHKVWNQFPNMQKNATFIAEVTKLKDEILKTTNNNQSNN